MSAFFRFWHTVYLSLEVTRDLGNRDEVDGVLCGESCDLACA